MIFSSLGLLFFPFAKSAEDDIHFTATNGDLLSSFMNRLEANDGDLAETLEEMFDDEDDLMMITDTGTIIRTPVRDIPTYSRTAAGVIVMRLEEDVRVVNLARLEKEEETLEEIEAAPDTVEVAPETPETAISETEDGEEAPPAEDSEE